MVRNRLRKVSIMILFNLPGVRYPGSVPASVALPPWKNGRLGSPGAGDLDLSSLEIRRGILHPDPVLPL
jgi:hypothetical protein